MDHDIDSLPEELSTAELRRVIDGSSHAVPQVGAVREYARRRTRKAAEFLATVASNTTADPSVRFEAALAIAATTQRNRSELLVGLLRSEEPLVQAGALRGLAAAGDESALDALMQMETRPSDAALARDAAFAATMISHRAGLDRHAFTMPPESRLLDPDPGSALPIEVGRPRPADVAEALERARAGFIGFDPSDTVQAHAITCVGRKILVVPDRTLEPQRLAGLLERPAIAAGVFTGAELSLGQFELSSYVLTKPGRRTGIIEFSVWSNRGRMWIVGTAEFDGSNSLSFEAHGVDTKNATPALFRGRFRSANGSWEVDTALTSPRITRDRRPAQRPTRAPASPS